MNFNTTLEANLKEYINDETRPCIISFVGQVDHGKSTFFDSLTKQNVTKKETGGITQNLYYALYNNFFLLDAPGHESFSFMKKNVLNISDIVLYFISPFESTRQSVENTLNHLKSLGIPFFVILTKLDAYKKEIHRLTEKLSNIGVIPKELGGDIEMYAVNYGAITDDVNIRCFSPENIMHDISEIISMFSIQGIKGNVLYCVDKIRTKQFGEIHIFINFMCRTISINQKIHELSINRLLKNNAVVKESNDMLIFASTNDIEVGMLVSDKKTISLLPNTVSEKRKDYILTIGIFAPQETRAKVLKEYVESKNWLVDIAFVSVGQPDNLVLADVSAKSGVLLFFGILSTSEIKNIRSMNVKIISSDSFYKITEELEQYYEEIKSQYDFDELKKNCISTARIKKIFSIKKDTIAGCDVVQGSIKITLLAYIVRGKLIVSGPIKINSMKIKSDDVQLACRGEEVGLLLNTNTVFKENDRILFTENYDT